MKVKEYYVIVNPKSGEFFDGEKMTADIWEAELYKKMPPVISDQAVGITFKLGIYLWTKKEIEASSVDGDMENRF